MANGFTKANNYGNYFSNNNGNHIFTTIGHKYDDSSYVITHHPNVVSEYSCSKTKNGQPANNVTVYGNGYAIKKMTQTTTASTETDVIDQLDNINTLGYISGAMTFSVGLNGFSVGSTRVGANANTFVINLAKPNYKGTTDTRGYRYVELTLKPKVPANPEAPYNDDGTSFANANVPSTTYYYDNRQGFLNREEPKYQIKFSSSYGATKGNPFWMKASNSASAFKVSYNDHIFDYSNVLSYNNTAHSYSPYNNNGKWHYNWGTSNSKTLESLTLTVNPNYLSTYPKQLTMTYNYPTPAKVPIPNKPVISYSYLSYDACEMNVMGVMYNGSSTYQGVTTSTATDTRFTTYERSTTLSFTRRSLTNSSTALTDTPTSYTIIQDPAILEISYAWSIEPSSTLTDSNNGGQYWVKTSQQSTYTQNPSGGTFIKDRNSEKISLQGQVHSMGKVSGVPTFSFANTTVNANTNTEGTFGTLTWIEKINRDDRSFNLRVKLGAKNYLNQNITSITNEYYSGDHTGTGNWNGTTNSFDYNDRKPMVTLKCTQRKGPWGNPGLIFTIKGERTQIYNDDLDDILADRGLTALGNRFTNYNPYITIYNQSESANFYGNSQNSIHWSSKLHTPNYSSTSDTTNNTKLRAVLRMPSVTTPYIKNYISGSVSVSPTSYTFGIRGGTITLVPTWYVNYKQGYNKGYGESTWKFSVPTIAGNEDIGNKNGDGMNMTSVVKFTPFTIKLKSVADSGYQYPSISLAASLSNGSNSAFSLSGSPNTVNNATSLASGHKSSGFTVKVGTNYKSGSTWNASVEGSSPTWKLKVTSNLKDVPSRSCTVNIGNPSWNTNLTTGSLSRTPATISVSQNADTWPSLSVNISENGSGFSKSIARTLTMPHNQTGNGTATSDTLSALRDQHQLLVTDIGTVALSNITISADGGDYSLSKSGSPTVQQDADYTYPWNITASCSNNNGVNTYPTNHQDGVIASGKVKPLAVDWKYQYATTHDSWKDENSFSVDNNFGTISGSSCTLNGRSGEDIKNGAFNYIPKLYNETPEKNWTGYIRVHDNSNGTDYGTPSCNIKQYGTSSYYISDTYYFSITGNRCSTSKTSDSVSGTNIVNNIPKFTVTPDSLPWIYSGASTYQNGMVPNSHSNSITNRSIYSGNATISQVGSSKTDYPYGQTISETIGISGTSSIIIKRTYTAKYRFYYDYTVTCTTTRSSINSTSLTSDERSTTYDSNNYYYLKVRWKNSDGSWSAWSSTLTKTAGAGTHAFQGGWVADDGDVFSTTDFSITLANSTRQWRIACLIDAPNSYITSFDSTGDLKVDSYRSWFVCNDNDGIGWKIIGNANDYTADNYVTLNPSSYSGLNPTAGRSYNTCGSPITRTFVVTKKAGVTYDFANGKIDYNGLKILMSNTRTVGLYRYGKTYFNVEA